MKRHKCLVQLDKFLSKHNTRLVTNLFNGNGIFIATERIDNLRNGQKAKLVVAAFCPFCGKELPERKEGMIL